MPAKPKNIPSETIERARALRAEGVGWRAIGRQLGLDERTIRGRLDPDFWWPSRTTGPLTSFLHVVGESRLSDADAERALATVPPDTRSMCARLFGDPLPGRSALDQKQGANGVSPNINNIPDTTRENAVTP